MALTTEQKAAIQKLLDDARLKYHALTVGGSARVIVDQNGERIEFNTTNSTRLLAYIRELELQLAETPRSRGPIKTWLG